MMNRTGGSPRHELDVAIGILIALRRCSERQAFNEIAAAVGETGVGLGSICRALIKTASGTAESFDHRSDVLGVWGDLFNGRAETGEPAA